jgi:cytochrome P450
VFANPHRLDLERSPNPHLAFGHGAHICVGNMLARMVGMHAMGSLIRRFPDLQLVDDRLDARVDLFALRGVRSLRVRRV